MNVVLLALVELTQLLDRHLDGGVEDHVIAPTRDTERDQRRIRCGMSHGDLHEIVRIIATGQVNLGAAKRVDGACNAMRIAAFQQAGHRSGAQTQSAPEPRGHRSCTILLGGMGFELGTAAGPDRGLD
jgi:hypothetical protein